MAPFTAALLAAVVLAVASQPALVGAVSGINDCKCINGGHVAAIAPRCVCTCPTGSGWLAPTCSFTANDTVRLTVVFDNTTNAGSFSSITKARAIRALLGVDEASASQRAKVRPSIRFPDLAPADGSEIFMLFLLSGELVDRFVDDVVVARHGVRSGDLSILRVTYSLRQSAEAGPLADGGPILWTTTYDGQYAELPWGAMEWFLGGLVALIVFPIFEGLMGCACSDDRIEDDHTDFDEYD
jgi:hypothetical protein